ILHPPLPPAFPYTTLFRSEVGNRTRLQGELLAASVAAAQDQALREEVEVDLQVPALVRHRRRGQPRRGDVERDLPPVVHHRRERSEEHTSELQSLRHLVCR